MIQRRSALVPAFLGMLVLSACGGLPQNGPINGANLVPASVDSPGSAGGASPSQGALATPAKAESVAPTDVTLSSEALSEHAIAAPHQAPPDAAMPSEPTVSAPADAQRAAPEQTADQEAVLRRAAERWQAILGDELEQAYALLPPSQRAVVTFKQYRNKFSTWVVGYEVLKASCETETCTVKMRLNASFPGARGGVSSLETHVDETWVRELGQWWYLQR